MNNLFKRIIISCGAFYILFLVGCDSGSFSSSSFPYTLTIEEGRAAAIDIMKKTGASSLSLAFINEKRLIWSETFGLSDKDSKTALTVDTMYPVCSMSKMVATIAAMKLVDQGQISLNMPVVNYIPSFSMLSPEHKNITIRMLLNHSSGLPGADYRNAVSASPLPFSYSEQILETLSTQRLKHAPGYMNVYCNEGFTLIEQLVLAVTGRSYEQFVQEEIFDPLDMNNSRYPLDYFPDGSFAKIHEGDTPLPQLFVNDFASGGLYSTPTDMAKLAMMLINNGKIGKVKILSEESVNEMSVDQTIANFNPVKSYAWSYGLGWDTVLQPGLGAVGSIGWLKTGDFQRLGTVMAVEPSAKLAVIIMGASGTFSSRSATVIAERILLKALAEKKFIAEMPALLELSSRPEKTPTNEFLDSISGHYASNEAFMRVQRESVSLNVGYYNAATSEWNNAITGLKLRDDNLFTSDNDPYTSFSFKIADGRQYLVIRTICGYGHYQDDLIYAQQITPEGTLPAAWSRRLDKKWLMTNEHPEFSMKWDFPVLQLYSFNNLLLVKTTGLQVVDPFYDDFRAGMMLLIPQQYGKELDDTVVEVYGEEEWIRFGSYLYRPEETIPELISGSQTISIGAQDLSEWRSIDSTKAMRTVTVSPFTGDGQWKIYDKNFVLIETGKGTKGLSLSGGRYYFLFHDTATVTVG
jgi:CubicO group peptidase (beta-lactamase class C family)